MKKILVFLAIITSLNLYAQNKISGSLSSFEMAFKGLLSSDGNRSEDWDIEIGKMIKTHPTNFLETLKKFENRVKRLDSLVGNFGYEFVDRLEAQKEEAQKRIRALRKASERSSDKEIKRLAKKCIRLLNKF